MKQIKRNKLVDALKGYACLLVVLGHVMRGVRSAGMDVPYASLWVEMFMWTFHIHLFMFLSGYVYNLTGGWKSKGSRRNFIKHKLLNIGVPYAVFSVVYIVINSMVPAANNHFKPQAILFIWKEPVAQYWFLYALFMLFVIWVVLSKWLSNIQITVLIFLVTVVKAIFGINFGFLESAMSSSFAFGLGTCIQPGILKAGKCIRAEKIETGKCIAAENAVISTAAKTKSTASKLLIIAIHILTVVTLTYMGITNFGVRLVKTVLGILASAALISGLVKIKAVDRFLQFICRYSLPLYLLHGIFTGGVRVALMKVGVTNYAVHIVCGMAFGLVIPIIIAKIAEKNKYLDFLFYPSKYIEKKRQNYLKSGNHIRQNC